jgi:hypothetical protein
MPLLPLSNEQMLECGYGTTPLATGNLFFDPETVPPVGSRLVCLRENTILQLFPADGAAWYAWYICVYLVKGRLINGTTYPAGSNGIPPTIRNMYRNGLLPRDPGLLLTEGGSRDVYPVLFGEWYVRACARTWSANPYRRTMAEQPAFFAPAGVDAPEEIGVPSLIQFVRDDGEEPNVAGRQVAEAMKREDPVPDWGSTWAGNVFPTYGQQFRLQTDGIPFRTYAYSGTMGSGPWPSTPVVTREERPRPSVPIPDITEAPKRKIRLCEEN